MNKYKFREQVLSSGKLAFGGKSAENNEELVKQAEKNELVLHTVAPGSPFVNIKADSKDVSKEDLMEAAIFCARYSQAWKKSTVKKDVLVHVFLGRDISKTSEMKTGCFGVKKFKKIVVKKEDLR